MTLEELVDKIDLIATSDPNINTFVFDDLETVNELHATSYPLLLLRPTQDTLDIRADEQDYALELYLLDTYFQDDSDSLRKKFSDMQEWGVKVIQEMYDDASIKDVDNVTVNRGQEQYNDNLVVVQFGFTVRVHNCMRLLRNPTDLVATAVSSSQIDLTWNDRATAETNYEISRSTDNAIWTTIDTIASDSTSYSDTGLDASTLYYYRVRAISTNNRSVYSNTSSDTTTV